MVHHPHPSHHELHLVKHDEHHVLGPRQEAWQVKLTDPALSVMTDFLDRSFFTVDAEDLIDDALDMMKHAGLRAAFVLDKKTEHLMGVITAYDIMGEKPLRFLQSAGFTSHRDVHVSDIMEHTKDMAFVDYGEAEKATVQSVLDILQKSMRTHLPVVEKADGKNYRLRGLFSTAKVLRLTEESRKAASGK